MTAPDTTAPGALGAEIRALIREVIREQLGATGTVETVALRTDADLAMFVTRLLDMDPAERDAVRDGRKRFRLAPPAAAQPGSPVSPAPVSAAPVSAAQVNGDRAGRRIERGAVTERMVRAAARAGERLVLGPAAVLTPLAADRARADGVPIEKEH